MLFSGKNFNEVKPCNRFCHNGGKLVPTRCVCKGLFTGKCCQNGGEVVQTTKPSSTNSKTGDGKLFLHDHAWS